MATFALPKSLLTALLLLLTGSVDASGKPKCKGPRGAAPRSMGVESKAVVAALLKADTSPFGRRPIAPERLRQIQQDPHFKDFTWLDLRETHLDLSDRDLTGADFTGAHLGSVEFRNAVLKDAQLFSTDIRGARNLDLSQAVLHPFFQTSPGESVGALRTLRLERFDPSSADRPDTFAVTRNKLLFWTQDQGRSLKVMSPTGSGYRMHRQDGGRILAIKETATGRLCLFGDRGSATLPLARVMAGERSIRGRSIPGLALKEPPLSVYCQGKDAFRNSPWNPATAPCASLPPGTAG